MELRGLLYGICFEENNPDAKVRRRKDGARLVGAVKSSAVDLAGIDYTSSNRPPATEAEVDLLFQHLMKSLRPEGGIPFAAPAPQARGGAGTEL
jgi:hypothetical protein